jgi:hypothetical protein
MACSLEVPPDGSATAVGAGDGTGDGTGVGVADTTEESGLGDGLWPAPYPGSVGRCERIATKATAATATTTKPSDIWVLVPIRGLTIVSAEAPSS